MTDDPLGKFSDHISHDDALAERDRRISELRKEADMMHSEYKIARARVAEFTANYNDALKTIAAQARAISEMRDLIYRASHLVDAAKKCGLQARATDLGEKDD